MQVASERAVSSMLISVEETRKDRLKPSQEGMGDAPV